jgi:hypothetical protein
MPASQSLGVLRQHRSEGHVVHVISSNGNATLSSTPTRRARLISFHYFHLDIEAIHQLQLPNSSTHRSSFFEKQTLAFPQSPAMAEKNALDVINRGCIRFVLPKMELQYLADPSATPDPSSSRISEPRSTTPSCNVFTSSLCRPSLVKARPIAIASSCPTRSTIFRECWVPV